MWWVHKSCQRPAELGESVIMRSSNGHSPVATMVLVLVAGIIFCFGGMASRRSFGQSARLLSASSTSVPTDDLQRSARIDTYTLIADHGIARGENIYFYKC